MLDAQIARSQTMFGGLVTLNVAVLGAIAYAMFGGYRGPGLAAGLVVVRATVAMVRDRGRIAMSRESLRQLQPLPLPLPKATLHSG